jgi:F-type H+-transporting ATPase subunit a
VGLTGAEEPIFGLNRIMLIRFLAVAVMMLILWLAVRNMRIVPTRFQAGAEFLLGFVRQNVIIDTLGEKDGRRFMPVLMAMFFGILAMNITGIIPGLNIAGTSVIGMPLVLALVAYVLFIYAGLKKHPGAFLKNSLFPSGVPLPIYIIVTPIEFLSTFVLRPVTLALRLLMNMVAGHLLLVLCFAATHFFFLSMLAYGDFLGLLGIGTLAFGLAFTLFEILVAVLQAYVFTYLAAVYIQLALADEH